MLPAAASRSAHKRTASELTVGGGSDGSSDGSKGARGLNKGKAPSDYHSRSHGGSVAFLGSGRGVRHSVTGPQCPWPATRGGETSTRTSSSSSAEQREANIAQSSRRPDVHELLQPPPLSGTVCRVAEPPGHSLLGGSFEASLAHTYASSQEHGSSGGNGTTDLAASSKGHNPDTSGGTAGKRGRGASGPASGGPKGRPTSAAAAAAAAAAKSSGSHPRSTGGGGGGGRSSGNWGGPGGGNNSDDQSGGSDDDDDDDLPLPPPGSASTLEEQRELQLLHR